VATDALFTNMLQDTSIDSTWLEPAGLPANRLLWWRVSACRVVEALPRCSAWSAPRSFKTRPGAPSLTFPPADALVENLTPGFTWLQADDAARFELQIAADAAFSRLVRRGMTTVPLYYPGSELPRDQVFYWRVRAAGRYGLGAWSAGQAFHTPLQPADRPLR